MDGGGDGIKIVECLPHKQKELNSVSNTDVNKSETSIPRAREVEIKESLWLTGQPVSSTQQAAGSV